jgi:hypothetical protein
MHEYILYRISITIYNYNIYICRNFANCIPCDCWSFFFLVMTKHFHRWLHQYLVGHHLSKFMIVDKFPSCDAKRLQNKQPAWNNRFPGKLKHPRLHHTTIHGQIHGCIPYAWSYPPSNITYQISTEMFGYANIIPNQIYPLNYYCLASTMAALNSFSQNANRNYYPSGPII